MPKISAPTVAQHRAAQQRTLLDAAHALLAETGEAPSMQMVADRAGLARSSVYQYFASRTDLLNALVQDVFPRWVDRVMAAMAAATTPGAQVVAYAVENLKLVDEGAHAVGSALAAVAPGAELDAQAARMHRQIQEPLLAALEESGVAHPDDAAELINGLVHTATRLLESGRELRSVVDSVCLVLQPLAADLDGGLLRA